MNKSEFFVALKNALNEKGFSRSDQKDVIADYESMIDEAVSNGELERPYIQSLGPVKKLVAEIPMTDKTLKNQRDKIVATSPFIAVILFFMVGFYANGFAYSWLFFLLIPMTAIGLNSRGMERVVALSPFVFTFTFFGLGFIYDLWAIAWVPYTLIFPLAILTDNRRLKWLMFAAGLFVPALYLWVYYQTNHPWSQLVFAGFIPIIMYQSWPKIKALGFVRFALGVALVMALSGVYLFFGFVYGLWHPMWVIFLLIPISVLLYAQFIKKETVQFVAYTPLLSVILFIIIGDLFQLYEIAWLVFLMIPIAGVLSEKED